MDIYDSEEEQVEAIKKWFRENWKLLLTIVVLSIATSIGISKWRSHQVVHRDGASRAFLEFTMASSQLADQSKKSVESLIPYVRPLMEEYDDTVYASSAALKMVQLYFQAGELNNAEFYSEWLYKNSKGKEVREVAMLQRIKLN